MSSRESREINIWKVLLSMVGMMQNRRQEPTHTHMHAHGVGTHVLESVYIGIHAESRGRWCVSSSTTYWLRISLNISAKQATSELLGSPVLTPVDMVSFYVALRTQTQIIELCNRWPSWLGCDSTPRTILLNVCFQQQNKSWWKHASWTKWCHEAPYLLSRKQSFLSCSSIMLNEFPSS